MGFPTGGLRKSCIWCSPSAAFLVCGAGSLLRSGKVIQAVLLPFRFAPCNQCCWNKPAFPVHPAYGLLRPSLVTWNTERPSFDCLACSLGKSMHGSWCRACPGVTAWCLKIPVVGMMDAEFQGVAFSLSDLETSSSMICVFQSCMGNQAFVQCWYKIRHIWSSVAVHLCGVQWHLITVCLHLVGQEGYSAGSKDSPA